MIRGVLSRPPRFLSLDEILSLHETAIDQHGGMYGVRDVGLLDAALAMPQQGFSGQFAHEVPFGMAAAYLFHLCKNHPFHDGNKRTSLSASIAFLRLNGWDLPVSEDSASQLVLDVATNEVDKEAVTSWFEKHARPRSSVELREFFRQLDYRTLASTFSSIAAGNPEERYATIIEASSAIPSVSEANIGALHAEEHGDASASAVLRQHSMLLTAIFRIAEDTGYEW